MAGKDREVARTSEGARICRWFQGQRAALSLRFDDSLPTHVEKAEPVLTAHGLIGTFLINPGTANYAQHRAAWEGTVIQHGHELGNHTLHHRGARTDREAEVEIGGCAAFIRDLRPSNSALVTARPAACSSGIAATAVREANTLGVRIARGALEDLAPFALDQPAIEAAAVTAVGRSCFIRRVAGEITAAVLHSGQCISAHGGLPFETDSCGHAALTFGAAAVTAQLDIYGGSGRRRGATAQRADGAARRRSEPGGECPLLAHAEPGFFRTLSLTALLTGARHNELLALKWGDIDLEGVSCPSGVP